MINNSKYKGIGDGTDMIFDGDVSDEVILLNDLTVYENTEWKEEKYLTNHLKIPKQFEFKKIEEISKITKGKQLNKSDFILGEYPFYNGGKTPSGFINDYNKENKISISEGGASSGSVNLIKSKFWSGGHNYTLDDLKINQIYLYFVLQYNQSKLYKLQQGSALPNIPTKELKKFNILMIDVLEEQHRIRSLLTKQEDIIENINKSIDKTRKIIKYYHQELLSGRLRLKEVETINGKEIVVYENTEWKEEKVNGRIEVIPEDWCVDKLKNISDFKPGYAFKEKDLTKEVTDFKLLKIGNIDFNGKYKKCSNNQFYLKNKNDNFLLFKNDIILAMDDLTPNAIFIGTSCIVEEENTYLNQRIGVFRNLKINFKYLNLILNKNQKNFKQISTGSTGKNLSKKTIENVEISFSYKEQYLIRDFLTKLDDNLELLLKTKEKEEKTFKFLQQEFLSGKLRLK